jgi:hypothetical protein
MFGDYVADDFNVNFPTINLPYVEGKFASPQSKKFWYNYLIVYEGNNCNGRDFESYDHIITFKDISDFEGKKERESWKTNNFETILVTNVVLLSCGEKDIAED